MMHSDGIHLKNVDSLTNIISKKKVLTLKWNHLNF